MLAVASGCSTSEDERRQRPEPLSPLSAEGLTEDLRALARIAEAGGGDRATGTPGYAASVKYVADELRAAGWRVRLQRVPLEVPSESAPPQLTARRLGDLEPLRDFRTLSYSGAGQVSGRVRRAGEGCAPWEFATVLPGDVALVGPDDCFNAHKAFYAKRSGARALIVAADANRRGVPSTTLSRPAGLPVIALRRELADRLRSGNVVALRVSASVARGSTTNVIAEQGRGRRVAMAGAHLDSAPSAPGINDNGSGVATLLAVARAYGERAPGRMRLAFWGAEELGLYGSSRYLDRLSGGQRRRIAGYLNLDMVGSPNAVASVYPIDDRGLTPLLRAAHPGSEEGLSAGGRSDHASFAEAGIPIGGLYTGSTERGPGGRSRDPCYHLPCDTLDNVDRRVLERMARATARALGRLARQAK